MCGLIGMIEPSRSREDRSTLGKFLSNHLRHRGPDQEGLWDDAETGLLMAHRRLSILDLSEHGRQPMQSASGRFIICLNGEIYNHQELRLKLQETGANFRGTSDTEVLLAAIEKWGLSESLRKCQGMFALSLWDKESRKLFLVRDRFGEKPLYYGWLKTGTFVFASELRALMAHPDYELEVFGPALNAYLDYNYVREPLSFDKKFKKLIPGEIIELSSPFQSKNLLTDSYWDTSQNLFQTSSAPKSLSFEESIKQLDHLLQEAIKNQMLADVPVGAFLSGGIDSSLVVSKMAQLSPRPIKTFSIGFEEEEYDESNVARQIARLFNTDHHEQILRPQDILERIQDIHTQPDEPFADCSYFPSYLLAKFAKESVSVCLTGDGGDEVFGGYTRYALTKRMYEIKARLPRALQKLSGRLSLLAGKSLPEALLKMLFSNYFRSSNIRQNFDRLAEVLGAEDLWKIYELLMTNRRGHYVLQKDWQEADQTFSESPNSKRLSIIERLILRDTLDYLPGDILFKVDRSGMAHSLETRMPYLDHRIVELAWSLPESIRMRGREPKALLKALLAHQIPQDFIDRPKKGFAIPIAQWLKSGLRDWAEDRLSERSLRARGFLDTDYLRRQWSEHLAGKRNWEFHLWNILMLQEWYEMQASITKFSPKAFHKDPYEPQPYAR